MQNNFNAAVLTLGCRVNQYESDCIISEFINLGFNIKDFNDICDVYVINTCTVTAASDKKSRQMIRRAKKLNPDALIAVCGCLSQREPDIIQADIIFGASEKVKIPQTALDILTNNNIDVMKSEAKRVRPPPELYENINAYNSEKTRAYIKIQDGCGAKCSYCIIPQVRGGVKSRKYADIYAEIERFDALNYHEIVLTGIEISSYGKDLENIDLISLLEKLDSEQDLDNIISIRLSSLDPSVITKDFIDRLSKLNKIANHFHLSVQSGSAKILNLMRRKYNPDTIIKNIERAKEKIKDLNITADIIAGFPGETNEDFCETIEIIKILNIYRAHIFVYSKRPGTDAAGFDGQIEESVKKSRSKKLSEVCEKIREKIHENNLGKEFDVIIEDYNKSGKTGFYTAKTRNFLDVKINACEEENNSGETKKIKIKDYNKNYLTGEII
ncbi:MAG: tRNA (N(6)-L-threonylcarbamoyladenosine(37)-C(2))-methylthiotransferase MtaB [Oscillospiraceae bacterium]|nr:tRNA (N(6)-L-threonylcarbamoyladenosine(37)-C(2))-methylthiotransferase MtaB [Oscillospiraceae bacterium]